jgi:hypothetical protein
MGLNPGLVTLDFWLDLFPDFWIYFASTSQVEKGTFILGMGTLKRCKEKGTG